MGETGKKLEKDFMHEYIDLIRLYSLIMLVRSCVITLNILRGLKTCLEVYNYMLEQDQCTMSLVLHKTTKTKNQVNKTYVPILMTSIYVIETHYSSFILMVSS